MEADGKPSRPLFAEAFLSGTSGDSSVRFVLWADRWAKSRSRDLRGRIFHHVPLAVLFVSAYVALRTLVDSMLGNFPADWSVTGLAPQYHWNFLIYSVLVGGIIAYDLEREARAKELRAYELEARLAEARLETLKAQLRPHFLFNTLNAISAFVEKDPKVARRMTAHLGDLLRHSLDGADRKEVPLAEELATVDDYLAIQQIRFAGRLVVERDVAPEALGASVPGFLLQPLVENAVEHGLLGKPGEGRILLRAERIDGSLRLDRAGRWGRASLLWKRGEKRLRPQECDRAAGSALRRQGAAPPRERGGGDRHRNDSVASA